MTVKCLFAKIKDLGLTLKRRDKGFYLFNDKVGGTFDSLKSVKYVVNVLHRQREV